MSKRTRKSSPACPAPADRAEPLRARRNLKMARSAQRYIRGSTVKFYEWLNAEGRVLPEGPKVWICGDCHFGNLGPVANAKDEVAIQIRDFDQTVVGNPAHDLIRLALSLASAARGFDLPGAVTARMIEQMVEAYVNALTAVSHSSDDHPPSIKGLIRASRRRTWSKLAHERIGDPSPSIPLGKRFWPLKADERQALTALVGEASIRELITALYSRPSDAEVELLDAAYWVKGCSSLGLLRYALLVGVGEGDRQEHCLIDVKEAIKASAPRAPRAQMPKDNAERVAEGARRMSPHLGERMRASRMLDRSVFVRELRPQDLKLEIDTLDADEAVCVAGFLAGVIGRAHARQLTDSEARAWAAELKRNRSKSLEAPSWLWSSVVDLTALHEAAYLDHCRRYAKVTA